MADKTMVKDDGQPSEDDTNTQDEYSSPDIGDIREKVVDELVLSKQEKRVGNVGTDTSHNEPHGDPLLAKTTNRSKELRSIDAYASAYASVERGNQDISEMLISKLLFMEEGEEDKGNPRQTSRAESVPGAFPVTLSSTFDSSSEQRELSLLEEGDALRVSDPALEVDVDVDTDAGLVVANPVDQEDLPRAVEYVHSEHHQNVLTTRIHKLRARTISFIVCLAFFLVVALLLSLTPLRDQESAASTPKTTNESEIATINTEAPTFTNLLSLLPKETRDTIQEEPNSPQRQAYEWVLKDPHLQDYDEYRIRQRFALATLFYATDGPSSWWNKTNWLSYEHHECQWYHKPCFGMKHYISNLEPQYVWSGAVQGFEPGNLSCPEDSNGRLEHVWLDSNNLVGIVPFTEIAMMTNLKSISLGLNELSGTISTRIGLLSSLEGFALSNLQQLRGTVPAEIGLLTNLISLYLGHNNLQGTFPADIVWNSLTNLDTLLLSGSEGLQLTIPASATLTNMRILQMNRVHLTGTIPTEIGKLQKLESIGLARGHSLTGTVPSEIGLLSKLEFLTIGTNALTGTMPTELGLLTSAHILSLQECALSGQIPTELGLLSRLRLFLGLHENLLTGTIPAQIGSLVDLEDLWLSSNRFTGPVPSELGKLSRLKQAGLDDNLLTGTIPNEVAAVAATLYSLKLERNLGLTGTIPSELCAVNGTCVSNSLRPCTESSGLSFSCTEILCGCDCPCS